ncbi:MAG TPA: hypothetical protein VI306_22625 [Pyrinomonadaceae bacterium]
MQETGPLLNICFTVIGVFIATVMGFVSLLRTTSNFIRTVGLVSLILLTAIQLFVLGWGVSRLVAGPEIRSPAPDRQPGPAPMYPKSGDNKEAAVSQPEQDLISFNFSSRSDVRIRHQYCVDSDVSGVVVKSGEQVLVKMDRVSFDLCKYSSVSVRRLEFRVGIGRTDDIDHQNWRAIQWSKSQKGSVVAGSESDMTPRAPISITTRGSLKTNLANGIGSYGVVVSVYNPDRKGLYYLKN